jgi:DNA-binding MarR family transcriptional regulator
MIIDSNKIPARLSGSKLKVLCAIAEAEEAKKSLTMTELAKVAGVCTAAMTGTIDSLTKECLAQRRRPGDDRRSQFVELTREGVDLVKSMRPVEGSRDMSHGLRGDEGKEAA